MEQLSRAMSLRRGKASLIAPEPFAVVPSGSAKRGGRRSSSIGAVVVPWSMRTSSKASSASATKGPSMAWGDPADSPVKTVSAGTLDTTTSRSRTSSLLPSWTTSRGDKQRKVDNEPRDGSKERRTLRSLRSAVGRPNRQSSKQHAASVAAPPGSAVVSRPVRDCLVCYESSEDDGGGIFCGHQQQHYLCGGCLEGYVKAEAEEGRAHQLCCPKVGCRLPYAHELLRSTLDSATWACFSTALDHAAQRCVRLEQCPNPKCGAMFDDITQDSQNTLMTCVACGWCYCQRCREKLDVEDENFSHSCAEDGRKEIENALSYGLFAHCGNKRCPMTAVPIDKRHESECNAIKCYSCYHYTCYLCDADLGTDWDEAHRTYDPEHPDRLHAPFNCPLFNDEDDTVDEVAAAVKRRTTSALRRYLDGLPLEEQRRVLERNGDLLKERGLDAAKLLPAEPCKCQPKDAAAVAAAGVVGCWSAPVGAACLAFFASWRFNLFGTCFSSK